MRQGTGLNCGKLRNHRTRSFPQLTPVPSVSFDRVNFAYPGRPPVLRDVTFAVAPGEVLARVGRSGAGKSTILKLINRLLLPEAGRVEVEGRDTHDWPGIPLRRRIGYVLQDVGLFPHMTVEQNVGLVPKLERWGLA